MNNSLQIVEILAYNIKKDDVVFFPGARQGYSISAFGCSYPLSNTIEDDDEYIYIEFLGIEDDILFDVDQKIPVIIDIPSIPIVTSN